MSLTSASESETDSRSSNSPTASSTISERSSTARKVRPPLNQMALETRIPAIRIAAALTDNSIVSLGLRGFLCSIVRFFFLNAARFLIRN